jgi:hypothetical protein
VLLGCVNTGVSQESAKIQDLPCTEGSAKARGGGLLLGVRQHAFESARYNAHEDDVLDTKKFVQNRCPCHNPCSLEGVSMPQRIGTTHF